ncbi:hypothetical protein BDA99DRAFT_508965 [Phascolomyces articulosus]|uniref:RRM domain-containing protein n=1 Tax=Phascolomyces articulosus TaxID=60185 RepID=A0AAD5PG91_9FUNG|nr:hypothetical protein BDA99DRAFT_508965 [Phascolomyces articulosus]
MDRKIKVDHDEPRERKEQISEESNILFFANLDFSVTEGQLEDLFSQHGNVELITLLTKAGPENVSRGCGYAEFTEKEDAIKAFGALRNATIEGRPLRLDFAGPRGSDKVDNKKNHAGFKNKRGGFNNRGRGGFNSRGGSNNRGGFKSRGGFNKRGGFKPRA